MNFNEAAEVISGKTYKEIFDRSLDHLMIIDGHTGLILDVNSVWEPATGFSKSEITGMHFSQVFADGQISTLEELERVRTYDNVISTRLLRTKGNGTLPVEMWLTIVQHDGHDAILTVLRSVKERLEAEKKIEEMNKKLAELNSTKDKLFSIISHDLKNQFNVLLAFSEILHQENDTLPAEERAYFIDQIESVSRTSYGLLSNLLNWARSQTGNLTVHKEVLLIDNLIKGILKELNGMILSKELSVKSKGDTSIQVYADSEMLKSVIRNLLTNAVKFSFRGGEIEITVSGIAGVAEFCIRDHGVGMSPEQAAKIFETGTISTSGTENESGTGLGLTLCREFVEKLGGTIRCESAPGEGTSMFFSMEVPQSQN